MMINNMFNYIYNKIEDKVLKLIKNEVGNPGWFCENPTGVYGDLKEHREMIAALAEHVKVRFTKDCGIKVVPIKKYKNK